MSRASSSRNVSNLIDLDDDTLQQLDDYYKKIPPVENPYDCVTSSTDKEAEKNCKFLGAKTKTYKYKDSNGNHHKLHPGNSTIKKNFAKENGKIRSTYYDRCRYPLKEFMKIKSTNEKKEYLAKMQGDDESLPWVKHIKKMYNDVFKNQKSMDHAVGLFSDKVQTIASQISDDQLLKYFQTSDVEKTITYASIKNKENVIADVCQEMQKNNQKSINTIHAIIEAIDVYAEFHQYVANEHNPIMNEYGEKLGINKVFIEKFSEHFVDYFYPEITEKSGEQLSHDEKNEIFQAIVESGSALFDLGMYINKFERFITHHKIPNIPKTNRERFFEQYCLFSGITRREIPSASQNRLIQTTLQELQIVPYIEPVNEPDMDVSYEQEHVEQPDYNIVSPQLSNISSVHVNIDETNEREYQTMRREQSDFTTPPHLIPGEPEYYNTNGKQVARVTNQEETVTLNMPANIIQQRKDPKQKRISEKKPSNKAKGKQIASRSSETIDEQLQLVQSQIGSLKITSSKIPRQIAEPIAYSVNNPIEEAMVGDLQSLTLENQIELGSVNLPDQYANAPETETPKQTKKPKKPKKKPSAKPSTSRQSELVEQIEDNKLKSIEFLKHVVKSEKLNFDEKLYHGLVSVMSQFSPEEIENIKHVSNTLKQNFEIKMKQTSEKQKQSQNNEILASISTVMTLYLEYQKTKPNLSDYLNNQYKPIVNFLQKDFKDSNGRINFEELLKQSAKIYFSFALKKLKNIQSFKNKFSKLQSFINDKMEFSDQEKVKFKNENDSFLMRNLLGKGIYDQHEQLFSKNDISSTLPQLVSDVFEYYDDDIQSTIRNAKNQRLDEKTTSDYIKRSVVTGLELNQGTSLNIVNNRFGN